MQHTAAVTGASGHIGNNLCRELIHRGYRVKALVRNEPGYLKDLGIEFIQGDITDSRAVGRLLDGCDVFFHLAGRIDLGGGGDDGLMDVNVEGTRTVARLAQEHAADRKGFRLIHFSSIHALSHHPVDSMMDEHNPLVDGDGLAYDRSKAEAERIILDYSRKGLDAVILNPSSVLGVHDYKPSLLGGAIRRIALGRMPGLFNGGFDWVDVRDVASAAAQAVESGKSGERYILSGHWKDLPELAGEICRVSEVKVPPVFPAFLLRTGVPFVYLWGIFRSQPPLYTAAYIDILRHSNRHISSLKAARDLGYSPRPFTRTVEDTVNWFLSRREER